MSMFDFGRALGKIRRLESLGRYLLPEIVDSFMDTEYMSCTCFQGHAPCSFCIHPHNHIAINELCDQLLSDQPNNFSMEFHNGNS